MVWRLSGRTVMCRNAWWSASRVGIVRWEGYSFGPRGGGPAPMKLEQAFFTSNVHQPVSETRTCDSR